MGFDRFYRAGKSSLKGKQGKDRGSGFALLCLQKGSRNRSSDMHFREAGRRAETKEA